jgi:hypothetical protein
VDISVSLNGENFEQVIYTVEDDFEQLVAQNAQTIFGDKAIYIIKKKKMHTLTLGGATPDGFLIDLSDIDDPQFYIVEVELQKHPFDGHILPQINKLITSCKNSYNRQKLLDKLFPLSDDVHKRIKKLVGDREVYKFLKDTFDENQSILIIIDGPKPEFKEQMDAHTEWGKMVKVQIISHFKKGENNILTVDPPVTKLLFGDAISTTPEEDTSKKSKYTEQIHLEKSNNTVKNIYEKLKKEFLEAKSTLIFNPVQQFIGVRDDSNARWHPHRENIAAIFVKRKKVWVFCWLSENETKTILESHHHNIRPDGSESCYVEICDTEHWDEIQKLVSELIEKTLGKIKTK